MSMVPTPQREESRSWGRDRTACQDALFLRWCSEETENAPPRLCIQDLEDPLRFHHRLADWCRKQG
jgi:hypothetical protein